MAGRRGEGTQIDSFGPGEMRKLAGENRVVCASSGELLRLVKNCGARLRCNKATCIGNNEFVDNEPALQGADVSGDIAKLSRCDQCEL